MKIPVTILGGSDHRPGPLPKGETNLHSIGTCKGADVKIRGKRLVELLVKSFQESENFGNITIAGPAEVYRKLNLNTNIVDTDKTVGENLQAAIEDHCERHGSSCPMAIVTYDIVLQPDELNELYHQYERDERPTFWMPLVTKPENTAELGAFEWKPTYQVKTETSNLPTDVLPGHLAIFDPEKIDWALLFRLLNLAYESRNHNIDDRRSHLVKNILVDLFKTDVTQIRKRKLPHYTYAIINNGLQLATKLRNREIVLDELQSLIKSMFLRRDVDCPGSVKFPLVSILGLAEDVDTKEEAADVERMHPELK